MGEYGPSYSHNKSNDIYFNRTLSLCILQEEFYKEQYEKECSRHKETQDFLHGVKDNLTKVQKAKEQQKEDYEKKLEELTTTVSRKKTKQCLAGFNGHCQNLVCLYTNCSKSSPLKHQ